MYLLQYRVCDVISHYSFVSECPDDLIGDGFEFAHGFRWEGYFVLLIGRDGTSSDESDGSSDESRHVIHPVWRSPQLTTFVRGLDAGIEQRKRPVLGQKRKARS